MDRRSFMTGLFGTAAATAIVSGTAVAGDAFAANTVSDLTPEEQAVMDELKERHYISIPSRKSMLHTEELREKGRILKRLVHKNRVIIDFHIARRDDEADESCLVYYLPADGETPLDRYAA